MATIPITKKEFDETKKFLLDGSTYSNETADYFILIRKDGERVFYLKGEYKFFKNEDAFIRAAVRTVKRGY